MGGSTLCEMQKTCLQGNGPILGCETQFGELPARQKIEVDVLSV